MKIKVLSKTEIAKFSLSQEEMKSIFKELKQSDLLVLSPISVRDYNGG